MQRRNFSPADTNVTPDHPTIADQLIHNLGGQLERDGKTDAFRCFAVVALIKRQRVDAHQLAQ